MTVKGLTAASAPATCAFRDVMKARAKYLLLMDSWMSAQDNVPREEWGAYMSKLDQTDAEEYIMIPSRVLWVAGLHPKSLALSYSSRRELQTIDLEKEKQNEDS